MKILVFSLQRPSPFPLLTEEKLAHNFLILYICNCLPPPLLTSYKIKIAHLAIFFEFLNVVNQNNNCMALSQFNIKKKQSTCAQYYCTLLNLQSVLWTLTHTANLQNENQHNFLKLVNIKFQFNNNTFSLFKSKFFISFKTLHVFLVINKMCL